MSYKSELSQKYANKTITVQELKILESLMVEDRIDDRAYFAFPDNGPTWIVPIKKEDSP